MQVYERTRSDSAGCVSVTEELFYVALPVSGFSSGCQEAICRAYAPPAACGSVLDLYFQAETREIVDHENWLWIPLTLMCLMGNGPWDL